MILIETVKFVTQIFKLLTLRPGGRPSNSTNMKEKNPFEQQFKENIGKLNQEYSTYTLF